MNDDKKLEVIWVQPMREPQVIEIDLSLIHISSAWAG